MRRIRQWRYTALSNKAHSSKRSFVDIDVCRHRNGTQKMKIHRERILDEKAKHNVKTARNHGKRVDLLNLNHNLFV